MRSSRRLLLRASGAVVAAAALTATVAGPAYADRVEDGDDGSVRTASESGTSGNYGDATDDADDRAGDSAGDSAGGREDSDERKAERSEEAREAAADRAEARRDRAEDADDRSGTERDDASGRDHDDRIDRTDRTASGDVRPDRAVKAESRDAGSTDRAPAAPVKKRKHQGVYGLDKDPGSLAQDNLDGRTDQPGVYYPGLGTVEAPSIASR